MFVILEAEWHLQFTCAQLGFFLKSLLALLDLNPAVQQNYGINFGGSPALCTIQCTLYSVHTPVYTVNCTVYILHCTLGNCIELLYTTLHCNTLKPPPLY